MQYALHNFPSVGLIFQFYWSDPLSSRAWTFYALTFSLVCRGSIYRGLGLMVAASPCALAVAPLAYATAISSLASKVLFKSFSCSISLFDVIQNFLDFWISWKHDTFIHINVGTAHSILVNIFVEMVQLLSMKFLLDLVGDSTIAVILLSEHTLLSDELLRFHLV